MAIKHGYSDTCSYVRSPRLFHLETTLSCCVRKRLFPTIPTSSNTAAWEPSSLIPLKLLTKSSDAVVVIHNMTHNLERSLQRMAEQVSAGENAENNQSVIAEGVSEQPRQERAKIMTGLHSEPASSHLQAYFERLDKGSPTWDIAAFIEGFKNLADLCGPERVKYYNNPLKGLRDVNSFTELWNHTYPQQAIGISDSHFRRQCPPSWSSRVEGELWVLSYQGQAPLGQGLNELLEGPTTIDCGMHCQLALWMAIRYLVGDEVFHKAFKFQRGEFKLTQVWHLPMDGADGAGNMLYYFYDDPPQEETTDSTGPRARIQTRTFWNDVMYLAKHPGGTARLEHVIQIDDDLFAFDPPSRQNVLSSAELDQSLMQAYNAPRSFADQEKMFLWTSPDIILPDSAPNNYRSLLAETVKEYADHTLSESEWKDGQVERDEMADGLHLTFNFQRLINCLEETKDARIDVMDEGALLRAKQSWFKNIVTY